MSKNKISPAECLAWLQTHFPDLHATAEPDRNWIWLTGDSLKPCYPGCACDACKVKAETRKAIALFGFSFCRKGHSLPSGRIGTWAHSCLHPVRFKPGGKRREQSTSTPEDIMAQAIALIEQ